jgi:hypothetical protein
MIYRISHVESYFFVIIEYIINMKVLGYTEHSIFNNKPSQHQSMYKLIHTFWWKLKYQLKVKSRLTVVYEELFRVGNDYESIDVWKARWHSCRKRCNTYQRATGIELIKVKSRLTVVFEELFRVGNDYESIDVWKARWHSCRKRCTTDQRVTGIELNHRSPSVTDHWQVEDCQHVWRRQRNA